MGDGYPWRPRLAAAAAGALLLVAGAPAAAQVQGDCPRSTADTVDQGYRFAFDSFWRKTSDGRRQIVYCVVNLHRSRNVWVDWPDAGLQGWVRVGRRGSASTTGPEAIAIGLRKGLLWYGSKPRTREVRTAIFAGGPAPAGVFASTGRPTLIRAAFQEALPAPAGSWSSTGSIDIPITAVIAPFLAKIEPKRGQAGKPLSRSIFRLLVRYLESRPEALVPFEMTFTTESPVAPGGPALRYSCAYRAAPGVLLRFDDRALHRTMFGSDALFPVVYSRGPAAVMRSPSIAAPAGVESRTGRLEILLLDGVTVIGSIGFDYLAPVGG